MSINEDIVAFDPNGPGIKGALFGLPFTPEEAELIIIPVPWEVTVSYREGTAKGPEAVLYASNQVDLYLRDIPEAWKMGVAMLPVSPTLKEENEKFRRQAAKCIQMLEDGTTEGKELEKYVLSINEAGKKLTLHIKGQTLKYLQEGKMVALLGGDHSTPLGLIQGLSEIEGSFGILQVDAHADLRESYEGFTYSHASIMHNALKNEAVSKLVQVGIRDYCEEEANFMGQYPERIITYFDQDLKSSIFEGRNWKDLCLEIVENLPQKVYLSLDIDGLDPSLGPNTGTPVPGGLDFSQLMYLIRSLVLSGRRIIGFDLCEVAPGKDAWDADVGARLLYQISALMGVSQGRLRFRKQDEPRKNPSLS